MRRLAIAALVLLPFGWISLLAGRYEILEGNLPGGLPVGNLLSAITFAVWPAAAVLIARPGSLARRFAQGALALALAWLPVSLLLAGNLGLNFEGTRGTLWMGLTVLTLAAGAAALACSAIHRLLRRKTHPAPGGEP